MKKDYYKCIDKLREFRQYPDGWASGEGSAFSEEVFDKVTAFLNQAYDYEFYLMDVFPGLDGIIRVVLYNLPHHFEFDFNNSEDVDYCYEYNDEVIEEITFGDFGSAIEKVKALSYLLNK